MEVIHILLIEDNPGDARLLRELIIESGLMGYKLTHVDRLSTALEQLAEGFNLVLLDLSLPDSEGPETLTRLHAQAPDLPIVVLTGLDDEALGVTLVQAGAQDYLVKGEATGHMLRRAIRYAIERKRTEEALRRNEELLRQILDTNPHIIFVKDREANIILANQALASTYQTTLADLTGRSQMSLHTQAGMIQAELKPGLADDQQVIDTGSPKTLIETYTHPDKSVHWYHTRKFPLELADGNQGVLVISEDITERRLLEEQLRQSQKMEAIGQMAGGIAHDFNNLLTVINGYSEWLLHHSFDDRDILHEYLKEIEQAGRRATALTRQLLAFSRKQVLQPEVLDLNIVVADMNKLLQRLIGEDIDLVTILKEGLGWLKADPGQLEQVIMNLILNARDAMPQGGKLTIETAEVELDEFYAGGHTEVVPGSYVMLAVTDTGTGMDQATLARIYEPFFTTKEPGKGTGLGLATVFGIVKQSGGHIWVYSEVGRGTTFKIYLPRVVKEAESAKLNLSRSGPAQASETIMLVEDADGVRELLHNFLRKEGYAILTAGNGMEALRLCAQYTGPLHLLVTDVVMPGGLNGRELAERLSLVHPEAKVLYTSGYTDQAIVQHGVLAQGMAFLQKPFTPSVLVRKIREILDAT